MGYTVPSLMVHTNVLGFESGLLVGHLKTFRSLSQIYNSAALAVCYRSLATGLAKRFMKGENPSLKSCVL